MTRAADPLVSTKLQPSQVRPKLVARPRVVESLTREPGHRLTLLSAPAGFGKTTLLNKWAKSRAGGESYVTSLSLDEGDNDPTRFLSYLVAALGRTVKEGFGQGVLAALRSPQPPRLEPAVHVRGGPRLRGGGSGSLRGSDHAGRPRAAPGAFVGQLSLPPGGGV
jgi:LuxR family maltose regulon positive regulatory protein